MRLITLIIWISLVGTMAHARQAYEPVLPESPMAKAIDRALEAIFQNTSVRMGLCEALGSASQVADLTGASQVTSERLFKSCGPSRAMTDVSPLKFYPRRYFVSRSKEKVAFESWTSSTNITYLDLPAEVSHEELMTVLAHELAITLDGKMAITLGSFQLTDPRSATLSADATSKLEERFRRSLYLPIMVTFSAMRAFNFEEIVFGRRLSTLDEHQQCVAKFREVFAAIESKLDSIPEENTFQAEFVKIVSRNQTPINLEETLAFILDENFKLPGSNGSGRSLTFCQYMAEPRLSNLVWNFLAHGPRPRLGGGWGRSKDERP